jgi:hypothetical protein
MRIIGVKIISCQTCLNYFNRLDKLLIGTAGDMKGTQDSIDTAGNWPSIREPGRLGLGRENPEKQVPNPSVFSKWRI